jgi:hypothetical protein
MKKTELKEIIRKEVRKAINESQGLNDFFYEPSETPNQGLNKFRTEPSNDDSTPEFKYPIFLPAANGNSGVSTKIYNKNDLLNWIKEFFESFPNETPTFEKSTGNEWNVTNPAFVARREQSGKNVSGYMAQYGTKGD